MGCNCGNKRNKFKNALLSKEENPITKRIKSIPINFESNLINISDSFLTKRERRLKGQQIRAIKRQRRMEKRDAKNKL